MQHATTIDAPTLRVGSETTWAYRRFGAVGSGHPLLLLPSYGANLDTWDPLLVDGLALQREVILLDPVGVGRSSGRVPPTVAEMARDVAEFLHALGVAPPLDVLGHGLGGMVAQELSLQRPQLVRRLVLAGTAAQGTRPGYGWPPDVELLATADTLPSDALLKLLFEITDTSQSKGRDYLARIGSRTDDLDLPVSSRARVAQYEAITSWGVPDPSRIDRLAGIVVPTLVACGDNDLVETPAGSRLLADRLPVGWLRVYPDAGHGFLFQYPLDVARLMTTFLG